MFDWHTHLLRHNAIVDIDPTNLSIHQLRKQMPMGKGYKYSVGIHPWNAKRCSVRDLVMLRALASRPDVVAIGEAGLDTVYAEGSKLNTESYNQSNTSKLPAVDDDLLIWQISLLKYHVQISEECAKPLILHIVRRFQEIIRLKKQFKPSQPWIIHGFRGKPQLARELLRHGFYLSFGKRYNRESYAITPPSRRLHETDEMP